MKLIGVDFGRVVLLFQPEEVQPKHGVHQKTVVQGIRDRYEFSLNADQVVSSIMKGDPSPGFIFKDGFFNHGTKRIAIGELGIYADGISVTASSTLDAERFVADVFQYLIQEFDYRPFKRSPEKLYVSQVVVTFDSGPRALTQLMSNAASAIGSSVAKLLQRSDLPQPSLTRVAFGWDKRQVTLPFGEGEFVIERRANVPHEDGHFFSRAPLPTEEHLKTLEAIEQGLS